MSNEPQKQSDIYSQLVSHGPQTANELGSYPRAESRSNGVRAFKPKSNKHGDSKTGTGRNETVYYIEEEHSAKKVVKKWVKINRIKQADISNKAIHQRICSYGEDFKNASKELLKPSANDTVPDDIARRTTESMEGKCPMCGETYTNTLPNHLPCNE